jgi:hypothetical protein
MSNEQIIEKYRATVDGDGVSIDVASHEGVPALLVYVAGQPPITLADPAQAGQLLTLLRQTVPTLESAIYESEGRRVFDTPSQLGTTVAAHIIRTERVGHGFSYNWENVRRHSVGHKWESDPHPDHPNDGPEFRYEIVAYARFLTERDGMTRWVEVLEP